MFLGVTTNDTNAVQTTPKTLYWSYIKHASDGNGEYNAGKKRRSLDGQTSWKLQRWQEILTYTAIFRADELQ
jgi:hypothetical protein